MWWVQERSREANWQHQAGAERGRAQGLLAGVVHVLQDGTRLGEIPLTRVTSHLNFPAGKVCAISSISSLCISMGLTSCVCLPSPARSSFREQFGVLGRAQQPNHGADSRPAPSPLLRSSWATSGAPWHPNAPFSRFTERAEVCSAASKCGRRWEPEGLWGRAWLHVTSWGSFSVCGSWRKFCCRRISRLCSVLSFRQLLHPRPRCH